jgi:regulator of protease activity HflC (stomatin/prohibitin superfamily)
MFWIGLGIGTAVFAGYYFLRAFFRIDEGHVGVVTTFGAAQMIRGEPGRIRTYPPGLHLKWPWQKVLTVSLKEQNLVLHGADGGQTVMAEDGTVLRFDSTLRFAPTEEQLSQFLFELRRPFEHINGIFACLVRNEIADFKAPPDGAAQEFGGSYGMIRRHRRALNARIDDLCRREIGERYGIRFSGVDLTDIHPPEELADALNAVVHAQTEAATSLAHAQAEAQQRELAAARGVQIAKAYAEAAEREIVELARHLEDLGRRNMLGHYLERRRAEVLSQSKTLFLRSA